MTLQPRDQRALVLVGLALILGLVYRALTGTAAPAVVPSTDSVELAEKRLARLREVAATAPGKEEVLKKVSAELATREKGLIVADTGAQATGQLLLLIRRLASAEAPPIEIRSTEIPPIRPFGDVYGEADVSVTIDCHIDQLVNLLSRIASQPELVSTSDLRIAATSAKDKLINVRLTVAGIVPRKLVPGKKGGSGL